MLLFLVLIIASSFGFMLRTVEYLTVSREIDRISENYRPIGTLSAANDDWSADISEGVELLKDNPYVDYLDINRYCPAVLTDMYNIDLDGASSIQKYEAEFRTRVNEIMAWVEVEDARGTSDPDVFRYDFRVKELLYGYPDYAKARYIAVFFDAKEIGQSGSVFEPGKIYLIKGQYPWTGSSGYGTVLFFDLLPLEDGLWFLEGSAGDPAALRYMDEKEVEVQERNRRTLNVIATADMSRMPAVQESVQDLHLEEGRWLNHEDTENGRNVCVITKEFADVRGLKVGDTLRMTLQDRIYSTYAYVTDADTDTWETCDRMEVELEIVGLYSYYLGGAANRPGFHLYGIQKGVIYVPDSFLPETYVRRDTIFPEQFSFVLESPALQEAFLEETDGELDALGLTCTFLENNWESYYRSAAEIAQGARYSFVVFAIVLAFVYAATAFLYIWQRKREIAIARAAGIPAKAAAFAACFPMLLPGAACIFTGSILAWGYGQSQAEQSLAVLDSGVREKLPMSWFAGICLLLWLVLVLLLLTGTAFYAGKPVLEILQGNRMRGKKRNSEPHREGGTVRQPEEKGIAGPEGLNTVLLAEEKGVVGSEGLDTVFPVGGDMTARRTSAFPAMAGFVRRHLCSISLRLVCALMAAAVFVTASGWLRQSIENSEKELDEIYRTASVEATIVKKYKNVFLDFDKTAGAFICHKTIKDILDTGFVEDTYLIAGSKNRIGRADGKNGRKKTMFVGTTDIRQYLAKVAATTLDIHYGSGYGPELFAQECVSTDGGELADVPAVIVPEGIWLKWDLHPGDELVLADSTECTRVTVVAGGFYQGRIEGFTKDTFLVPHALLDFLEGDNLYYLTARFTLDADRNREADAFRETAEEIVGRSSAGRMRLSLMLWDDELRQTVKPMEKNISLMKLLYPIANIVSFLTAGGLAVLFLFQRRREAAILRVMGVGKRPVRMALAGEMLLLDLAGVLLGLVLIFAITKTGSAAVMGIAAGAYFLGSMIGAAAGCVLITRERPLELLQVKE